MKKEQNILEAIVKGTRERVNHKKKNLTLEELQDQVRSFPAAMDFPFEKALRTKGLSFICEVKKASPSRGIISPDFPYLKIAQEYEQAGASAISCLTEPVYFQGKDEYLREIAETVSVPVLRKDFVVDAYMIWEAKLLGASAVLLICAILTDRELEEWIRLCHSLGLSALVEAHTEGEVLRARQAGAKIIGVNNRDLKTFQVDINVSQRLKKLVPQEIIFVSESGIRTRADIELLERHGTDAVLIGETLMCSRDKKEQLNRLKGK